MAHARPLVGVGVELLEGGDELLRVHAEDHPVDGLELEGVVVEVLDLHQGVPGGKAGPLVLGGDLLEILIAGLGGGQGVVAVAHGEQQGGHAPQAVLALHGVVAGQAAQGVGQLVHLPGGELPAGEVAALEHEVKVIDPLHGVLGGGDGLHTDFFGVVDEQHHVGQLDGGVLPHPHAGGDALQHGALGGPDEGPGAGGVVVLLQVHRRHQAGPDRPVGLGALDVDDGLAVGGEDVPGQVVLHGAVDGGDVLVHVGVAQLALRQNQAQGGGSVSGDAVRLLPVLRLGGKLVAGHHGPPVHVGAGLGQQDVGGLHAQILKFAVHSSLLLHILHTFFFLREKE